MVSQRVAGNGLQQQMAAAAMRGFVAELGRQLKPGDQLARFKSSLKELANPANVGRFVGGYAAGAAAGFISPATDLLGLGALAEQLPAIAANLGKRAWNQAAALAAEAREIAASVAEFDRVARTKIAELLKDPAELYLLLSTMGPRAVAAAGEAGRTAASQVVGLFSGKDEPAEKTDASAAQALTTTTEEERSGVFSFLTSKATRLRKVWFSTPWSKLGYEVGHAIGAIISNLLLLIFSEGIGNAIAKIGAWLGEVAPFLARGAKALVSLGRAVESIEKAIALLLSKGVKLIKPLEAIIAPLFRMMERLQGFLRRLFGVAEYEAGALLAKGGATIAEESGVRGLTGGTGAAEETGARAAAPGGTTAAPAARPAPAATAKAPPGAETPPANVIPLKGAKRPPVSELTKAQQAGLSRAPKGSRSVGTVHGGEVPPGATPHAQPVPEAVPAAEEVPLARTGTYDPHAGSATDAPKAVGSGSGGPPPSRTRTPPPQTTLSASPPKRTAGATPPRVVRPVPAPKGKPPIRGATAESMDPNFKLEYHEPVGEVPQQRARAGARPAQREGVQPVNSAEQAPKREPFADEDLDRPFAEANEQVAPDERVLGGSEGEAATDPVLSPRPNQPTRASGSPSKELAAAMERQDNPAPPGHQTHHIVADRDIRARPARRILRSVGINPRNDPLNGVHLPQTTMDPGTIPEAYTRHPSIHTDAYYENLNNRIRKAAGGRLPEGAGQAVILDRRARVEAELQKIREEILNGDFPHPRKRD